MIVKRESGPTKQLFDFQKDAVRTLIANPRKHFVVATVGSGKGAISISWAAKKCVQTKKKKLLVITTSSKTKVKDELKRNDFEQDADNFVSPAFREVIQMETVSWDLLYKWVANHEGELAQWVYIADEIHKAKNSTSRRGKAFLKIADATPDWTGYTATPGDTWIDFHSYFRATHLIRNKTQFIGRFCRVQTFKGFPEIVGYNEEDTLRRWWTDVSYAPDTRKMLAELPKANYSVVEFRKPSAYDKVIKLRQRVCEDGTFKPDPDYEDILQNPSATAHYLRQLCWTKEKAAWVADFLEGLDDQCIIFYSYTATADAIEKIAQKVLPKGAKVWRIDGSHHVIPTKEMMGGRDIVLAQWQSGGEGLNMQHIHIWLCVEMTYAYSVFNQAKGRVMRIGQTRPVFYYLLLSKQTIEEDILACLRGKKSFSEKVWLLGQKLIKPKEENVSD